MPVPGRQGQGRRRSASGRKKLEGSAIWWNPLSSTLLYLTYRRLQRLEVAHGGNGWVMEKNLLVPGAPSQTCFLTSFL